MKTLQVRGYVTLKTTCGVGANAKVIGVSYLVVDALSPYNVILGLPIINALGQLFPPST